jgi:NADPH2:quinone reductase
MTATGGPDALEPADLPDPRPGPGELLVDVAAAGVNYIDTYHRRGVYPVDLPLVPGQEGAGRVTALGGGDTGGFTVGDRVVWANVPGGYAERVVVPAGQLLRSDAIPDDVAVGAYLQGMTAHFSSPTAPPSAPATPSSCTRQRRRRAAAHSWPRHAAPACWGPSPRRRRRISSVPRGPRTCSGRATAWPRGPRPDRQDGVAVAFDGVGRDTFDASLASLRRRGASCSSGPPADRCRRSARSVNRAARCT